MSCCFVAAKGTCYHQGYTVAEPIETTRERTPLAALLGENCAFNVVCQRISFSVFETQVFRMQYSSSSIGAILNDCIFSGNHVIATSANSTPPTEFG